MSPSLQDNNRLRNQEIWIISWSICIGCVPSASDLRPGLLNGISALTYKTACKQYFHCKQLLYLKKLEIVQRMWFLTARDWWTLTMRLSSQQTLMGTNNGSGQSCVPWNDEVGLVGNLPKNISEYILWTLKEWLNGQNLGFEKLDFLEP